ncbi:tandem-95 repeat protein, partial [bacterium]|nr:tandem-95 repeat protein [bacterium]
ANGAPLTSAGLSFAGGESPGDDDRIAVTGYAVETVVVNHDGPETGTIQVGTSGLVSFAEVEPVLLDGTTDDLFINLPTMPNPDVAVGADGPSGFSAVSGSTFEYTRFRSPTRKLVVTLGGGGDSVTVRAMDPSFAPAELVIAGGAGSDSLLVAGGGGDDSVAYAPDSAGGGLLTLGGTTRVTLTGVESLTADGLGQSGADAVTVTAPRATVEFGFAAGSGLVTPTAANGSSLLALLYRNFEQAAVAATVVVVRGSEYDDTVGVSADGTVALGYAGGDGHEVRVSADQLTVLGLTGSDHFAVAANHPFAGGVLIDSEAAESAIVNDLTVIGSGGDVILIPDLTGAVTEAGYGTIRYAGMGRTAVDTRGGWLTLVSVVPGAIATAVLSGTNAAEFWLMAGGLVTAAAAGLTVEAPAGTVEQLQVLVDSAAPEDVTVAGGVVQFAGRLTVKAGRGVDALAVAGGPADDTFTVTPGPLPLTVDGGPHAAGDRLVLVGSYPGRLAPGAGSVANVSYQNIELLKLGSVPAAAPDTPSTNEGQPVSIPVLANDTGLGDGPFTVTVESAPAFGTVQVFGTTVVYTPYAGVTPDGGTDSFTYRVEDANGESSVGTVTVTVRPVNAPPVAFTQSVVGPANGSLVLALWADDGDPETAQGLTFTILTAPRHGALTGFDPATGQVTYTPFPGYDGPDSFTFAVTDDATAGGPPLTSPAATVFIQVNRSNRAPVAAADAVTIPQGSTYASPVGGVRNNDSDPDGDTLTVGLVTGPAHGVFSLDRRGTYTYTPDPGFFGTDSFVYTVTDPTGATATATATITVTPTPRKLIATGAGYGGGPHVKVFDAATGEELYSFFAYDASFRGGVRVAVGDVNGDGVPDIVTTPGPGGGPHVKVFSGADLTLLASFFSFDPNFRSGANVAVGDLDADGVAEVVTGAAPGGGSHVRSFRIGPGGAEQIAGPLGSFFAFGADFAGGVNIALGDYDGVAGDEIIVGAATLFPQVRVFGRTGAIIADFLAFDVAHVGITVAAGDVDGDGKADIIVGPGDGGGPVVRTFRGGSGELLTSIAAFDPDLRGGISVAAVGGRTEDGRAAVVAAPTEEARSILILDPSADALLDLLDAYSANFPGGVFVGAG